MSKLLKTYARVPFNASNAEAQAFIGEVTSQLDLNYVATGFASSDNHSNDKLLRYLVENKNLAVINIQLWSNDSFERYPDNSKALDLGDQIVRGGNKNLVRAYLRVDLEDSKLNAFCETNKKVALGLLAKMESDPASLTRDDYRELCDRLYGVICIADRELKLTDVQIASLLCDAKARAESYGITLTLPDGTEALATPLTNELTKNSTSIPESIKAAAKKIAVAHKVKLEDILGSSPSLKITLDKIETAIQYSIANAAKSEAAGLSNIQKARMEFTNSVLIPHLDYFLIAALRTMDKPEEVDFAAYPNIQRVAGTQYDLSKFKQQARSRQAEGSTLNFDYLRDPSQGDHMTRLRRALGEVNGTIGQYEGMFKAIDQQIAEIHLEIAQKRGIIDERGVYLKDARRANEFRADRMQEYRFRLEASLDAANIKSAAAGGKTVGQGAAMIAEMILDGVPILGGLSKKISQMVGVPNPVRAAGEAAMTQAIARTETRSSREIIDYYTKKQIDEGAIEREIQTIQDGVKKLEANTEFKRFEQDKTKQKAVAEAFVNKLMLTFGQHMSEGLDEICEKYGVASIDAVFDTLGDLNPRFQEAVTNLCFGYADSNDLSVIFAETAALRNQTTPLRHEILAKEVMLEFLETVLKPQIDSLYMHASKVDLIYQANLTGLGTDLHNARHMIRGEHDMRVKALFGDSFGVDSEMGALTIRGAVDVKNLFDYYMHRHGKTTLTDAKIHDGLMTDKTAPKGVSVLTDKAMEKHKELAIRAHGYRQDGPDISDMFLRICGYEYFRPQAPNGVAQGNIMANNPEAPASYQMTNRVIQDFIRKLSFGHIDDYRAKVGTKADEASKLDNLIAQTFMDFFAEVGGIHAADPKLGGKRSDLKAAAKETGTFGFAFDSYERLITKDALGRFDLFLEIYKRNLENQLRDASVTDGQLLREQITAVAEITKQQLNPPVVEPGSENHRHRARLANHTFENTHWRGVA